MKKYLLISFFFFSLCTSAQKSYWEMHDPSPDSIMSNVKVSTLGGIYTLSSVDSIPNKTKEQLYVLINYWYTSTFTSGKEVIQLNDKEAGVIIGKGFVEGIATHSGGTNSYKVNLCPIIKTDIKEGKIRITYTVPYYDVDKLAGGGILGVGKNATHVEENWVLDKCFPFAKKDSHKKTSSKALVMAHAYSNVIMDKIEEAVKSGMVGNESEDW